MSNSSSMFSMVERLEERLFMAADPGNTLATAMNLKSINGSVSLANAISTKDKQDFFRFSVRDQAFFNLSLSKLQAKLKVALLDSTGKTIESRSVDKGKTATIARGLEGGTYY